MKYMLMLFDDGEWTAESDGAIADELAKHGAFSAWCKEQGIAVLGGEALHSGSSATTVRHNGSDFVVTDGPVAEVKENLGGYYVIECRDLDQAIEAARHCPMGTANEVRPIWEFD